MDDFIIKEESPPFFKALLKKPAVVTKLLLGKRDRFTAGKADGAGNLRKNPAAARTDLLSAG